MAPNKPESLQDKIMRLTETAVDSRMHAYLKQDFSNCGEDQMSKIIDRVSTRIADSVSCRELIADKVAADIIDSRKKTFGYWYGLFSKVFTGAVGFIIFICTTFQTVNEFVGRIIMKFFGF